MALTSPGVQVSVIDESFYTPAEPGTRPLFIVATAANKTPSSGSGTAVGTTAARAGTVYTITSQRELAETFGDPIFKVDSNNNPIYAGELNEYGLQAAYSFLGVSNSALVVRANLDLNDLAPQADAPGGEPDDGTFWLDTANSAFGVFQWDGRDARIGGQAFTNKTPVVALGGVASLPASPTGTYAMVSGEGVTPAEKAEVKVYFKSAYTDEGLVGTGDWVLVGSDQWTTAWPVVTGTGSVGAIGDLIITTTVAGQEPDTQTLTFASTTLSVIADYIADNSVAVGARVVAGKLEIYAKSAEIDSVGIGGDAEVLAALGISATTAKPYATPKLTISKHTSVPQYKTAVEGRPTGSVWIKTTEPNAGARWRVKSYNANTKLWEQLSAPLFQTDLTANVGIDPTRDSAGSNIVVNSVYVQFDFNNVTDGFPGTARPVAEFRVKYRSNSTTWSPLLDSAMYFVSETAPETLTADGKLWYNSIVDEVDIMINTGTKWVGMKHTDSPLFSAVAAEKTDPAGPIVSATAPKKQSDNSTLVDGDLWVDTSDLENYPVLKRWSGDFLKWILVDTGDQTTENGIVFADARWSTIGAETDGLYPAASITSLLDSDFVDFDAPDPVLYPRGMLLWNLRRSGFNVKRFVQNAIDTTNDNTRYNGESMSGYYPHRWVTESANQANGSGSFGRHAQRKVVIQSLQALVNGNESIRDTERNSFNLMACPGYPELIGEMINLNYDRGLTAFVVGDSPARLNPSATSLNNWGTNLAGSLQDDDGGLVSSDEYLGVFYPWGFTSDNLGRDIAVPPSHMICRMIALNDQVAYPWFAPAGTRRGGITNATAVGYVTAEGEFNSIALNDGQRDTLYNVNVNPITYFTGAGLVNFGQKTRARGASALDRINVARLVIYLRNQLNKLAKPYIFEPNDKITRDEIKQQVESLLLELVGQRALYDFLVVCDESNNTPNRIDRSELHVDIAIEPVKAVEFIYIPVRLKNTGEIAGLGQ